MTLVKRSRSQTDTTRALVRFLTWKVKLSPTHLRGMEEDQAMGLTSRCQ